MQQKKKKTIKLEKLRNKLKIGLNKNLECKRKKTLKTNYKKKKQRKEKYKKKDYINTYEEYRKYSKKNAKKKI